MDNTQQTLVLTPNLEIQTDVTFLLLKDPVKKCRILSPLGIITNLLLNGSMGHGNKWLKF